MRSVLRFVFLLLCLQLALRFLPLTLRILERAPSMVVLLGPWSIAPAAAWAAWLAIKRLRTPPQV